MKVLKKAGRKNWKIDTGMYTKKEIENLLDKSLIYPAPWNDEETEDYVIFTCDTKTVQVEYIEEYDLYATTVTTFDGQRIFVVL